MHLESAGVSPGATGRGLRGHQDAGARLPGILLAGLAAIRYDPQDTQPSDIDLWRGRSPSEAGPASPGVFTRLIGELHELGFERSPTASRPDCGVYAATDSPVEAICRSRRARCTR